MVKPTALTIKYDTEQVCLHAIDDGQHAQVHGKTLNHLVNIGLACRDANSVLLTPQGVSRLVKLRDGDSPTSIISTAPAAITIHEDDAQPDKTLDISPDNSPENTRDNSPDDDLRSAARGIIRSHLHKTAQGLVPLFDALTKGR